MTKFIFDLDGTVTSEETLPLISKHFGIKQKIDELTKETIAGNIPFIESFIRRVHILGKLPVSEIACLLEQTKRYSLIADFIQKNKKSCAIATGNLDCWVNKLVKRIDCDAFYSEAIVEKNQVVKIAKILKKESVVKNFQEQGYKVVFIGDGNNDMEAMRVADTAIAIGITHYPSKSLLPICDYLIFNEKTLCRQLNQLF
ncbi:MAG: HAD-IB family phosphatase [Bacteroidales bacterium]|jgi:HAD superfamily phosphoserine phosphatase-like hydrolase|nr:HAD-IB family phosphatase [Bacteroidales bacterium]